MPPRIQGDHGLGIILFSTESRLLILPTNSLHPVLCCHPASQRARLKWSQLVVAFAEDTRITVSLLGIQLQVCHMRVCLCVIFGSLTAAASICGAEPIKLASSVFAARDTLAPIDEASEDAHRCLEDLVWPAADFKVRCGENDKWHGDLLVRFPSPIPSGNETNDLVAMEWYVARDSTQNAVVAPAVVVVHESSSKMVFGRLISRGLRERGLHAFLIHLPFYGQRYGGQQPSAVAHLIGNPRQAVADVRRARDAVAVLPFVDSKRIALQGTSLGGFVSATAACLDQGYDGVFLMLAGGGLYDVIQNGKRNAIKVRAQLREIGLEGDRLKSVLRTVEPNRVAHRLDPSRTWLYSGISDTVVPMKNALALAKLARLDDEHHIHLNANHYTGVVYLPTVLDHIAKRLKASDR